MQATGLQGGVLEDSLEPVCPPVFPVSHHMQMKAARLGRMTQT